MYVEIAGTLFNEYDRILVAGNAQIDGYLNIDIDGSFVPALGNTFDILSTTFGRSGTFATVDVSGMPPGRTFHVDYLANSVRLTVVNTPFFSADFDDDGDVDKTDLAIWRGAYDLNQLGDADGDNDSDGADLLLWQRQFGSHPGAARRRNRCTRTHLAALVATDLLNSALRNRATSSQLSPSTNITRQRSAVYSGRACAVQSPIHAAPRTALRARQADSGR